MLESEEIARNTLDVGLFAIPALGSPFVTLDLSRSTC
jgi:hypothetical protein